MPPEGLEDLLVVEGHQPGDEERQGEVDERAALNASNPLKV